MHDLPERSPENLTRFTARNIPEAKRPILAARKQPRAIRGHGDTGHSARMPEEALDFAYRQRCAGVHDRIAEHFLGKMIEQRERNQAQADQSKDHPEPVWQSSDHGIEHRLLCQRLVHAIKRSIPWRFINLTSCPGKFLEISRHYNARPAFFIPSSQRVAMRPTQSNGIYLSGRANSFHFRSERGGKEMK